jgi:hypothetical protein
MHFPVFFIYPQSSRESRLKTLGNENKRKITCNFTQNKAYFIYHILMISAT